MKRFVVAIIATILLFMAAGSSDAAASFPIKISQDRRIFEDATGKPFCCRAILPGR